MSLFNWFSIKSNSPKTATPDTHRPLRAGRLGQAPEKVPPLAGKSAGGTDALLVDRKVKRHARREQLYVAIRESMTRGGVLSASYKFKVLSLDHRGDQFLVMMDVEPSLGGEGQRLSDIETLLISTAKSLFSIYVTSVYWRIDSRVRAAPVGDTEASLLDEANAQPAIPEASKNAFKNDGYKASRKPAPQRYDPILDDEMTAFKQALAASTAQHSAVPDGTGKSRSGLRSFTLITGFEDTEMPESFAAPALSATQYGELR